MPSTKSKKSYAFFPLFDKFILDSKKGRRLQPNGKRISESTTKAYLITLKLLKEFSLAKNFELRIFEEPRLNKREKMKEKNYWKKFYKKFTDYLYLDKGCFDNYTGNNIKNIKAFFNHLQRETIIQPGNFHKQFYVRKENIQIFPLMPEELNFLIYDEIFTRSLPQRMQEVKDVFVFGCTVALRVSDLLKLKTSAIRIVGNQYYLSVCSQKTNTDTLIKLPSYCVEIIQRNNKTRSIKKALLPHFNSSNLNHYIKELLELAGFKHEVVICRSKRGKQVILKNEQGKNKEYRFCDVASTHTMRRTAITTMLCLGMPEQVVRKISGHAPGTKQFHRYVLWAQTYQDTESEKMFEKLKQKELKVA